MLVLFSLSMLYWFAQAVMAWRAARAVKTVAALPPVDRAWPTVSLVIPARDEGANVRRALEARLSEGYPSLEVVLVDDRSNDDTGAQARALAAVDPRVTVTRVESLPEGWLGKVNALQHGLQAARGEWILFSDADVHLAPGTLSKIIGWAEREGVDHVSALPSLDASGPLTTLCMTAFFRFVVTAPRLCAVVPRAAAWAGSRPGASYRKAATYWVATAKQEATGDRRLAVLIRDAAAGRRVGPLRPRVASSKAKP